MMENYRSTPQILKVANSLIDKNLHRIKKDLIPTLSEGAPVLCHHAKTSMKEAEWMASQMKKLHEEGVPYKDMTVLYRAHYVTRTVEEERRLAFVAVTRAEKGLYISEAEGRNFDRTPRYPSRFILDVDQKLITYTEKPQEGLIAEARDYIRLREKFLTADAESKVFQVGQRVNHKVFGTGTVLEVDMDKAAYFIQFDEVDTPRGISFRAKIEAC